MSRVLLLVVESWLTSTRHARGGQIGVEPTKNPLPVLGVPVGRLAAADEAFVANGDAGAGRNGVEPVSDRGLASAEKGRVVEPPRHDKLAGRIELHELTAATVGAAVVEVNRDAPLATDAKVRGPSRLTVEPLGPPP